MWIATDCDMFFNFLPKMKQILRRECNVTDVKVEDVKKDEKRVRVTVTITCVSKLKEGIIIDPSIREAAKDKSLGICEPIDVELASELQQHSQHLS